MKIIKATTTVFVLLGVTFLMGCSSTGTQLLPEKQESQVANYLIGPGDSLNIFVWRNPDLSTSVTVRPDGRISAPLIDDLVVSGLPPSEVADQIEEVLSTYIRSPNVSVIVSGFNGSVDQQIRVIGNATNPMVLPYREGMTLLDVMIAVQGLTEFADGDNAQLIRVVNGQTKQYTVLLDSLIRGGDVSKNRTVYPGDTIIIPESWF